MMSVYYLSVTLHVLAAVFWLGGMFFLAAVGAPSLRQLDAQLRARLFRTLGARFRPLAWYAIAVLVGTGIGNLHFRGFLTRRALADADFWATPYGNALALKLAVVIAMIAVSALHDFVSGPAVSHPKPGSRTTFRLRRWSIRLARINVVLAIILVFAAVRLARGG